MMLSNGGVVSADDAARAPIRLVESGPAAGALAGSWFARRLGEDRLLCFDMGGTTAKSCLIVDGEPQLTNTFEVARIYRFKKGSGFPVSVPSVDLVEIGAGGGSLAHVDELGLLKVGPESAGADPGPGVLRPRRHRARGHRRRPRARPARRRRSSSAATWRSTPTRARPRSGRWPTPLGLSAHDTAAGIHELVNQNMAAASRMHAVEQGADLRGVTVLAFGGAGPVHACGVAELLESPRVVFPVNASVLSAFGTLVTPVRIDLARSMVRPLAVGRRRRARRAADRAARRGPPGAGRRRRRRPTRSASGTASTPATSARATRSRSGSGEGDEWPVDLRRGRRAVRGRLPPHLRPDDPRRRRRGGHVAAVGVRRRATPVEPLATVGDGHRRRAARTRPVRFARGADPVDTPVYRRQRPRRSASRSSARRSSRSARPRRSSAPAGWPPSPPTDRWSPNAVARTHENGSAA